MSTSTTNAKLTEHARLNAPNPVDLRLCWRLLALLAFGTSLGCTGEIRTPSTGDPTGPGSEVDADGIDTDGDGIVDSPTTPDPKTPLPEQEPIGTNPDLIARACAAKNGVVDVGLTRLRRLTRDQYNNTTNDLLDASGEPATGIAADERVGPFFSNAITPIDSLMVEQYQSVAASLAADARNRVAELTPCDLSAGSGSGCATQFIEAFGLRAYRRPLESDEVQTYLSLYQLGQRASGSEHGFELVVEAMLQSPFFLYHVDVGQAGTPSATPVPVTPYELASRLSYFMWNSMPDDELFGLAASGALLDESTLASEVERMLAAPKAAPTIALFHRQWLALGELPERDKDASVYPEYTPALAEAMLQETASFSDYVVRQGDSLLSTLLTASFGFPRGDLFGLYGMAEPPGFAPGTPVEFDPAQRAGILTQAAFLARHAHRDQSSPVHRGLIIRENVLCQTIDPPPANVANTPPSPTEANSTRERFAQHSTNPTCANCHQLMDPIGLGFENYDAIGAWRTEDGLSPVDATGSLIRVDDDLEGDFDGAIELSHSLAASSEVTSCFANQWFRFALGRTESASDACSVQSIHERFSASGGNIRVLMAEIAKSEAFRYVRAAGAEETGP